MTTTTDSGVPVLSFPAILRNPGLSTRFAHLQGPTGQDGDRPAAKRHPQREQVEGKRWLRRKDNDRFVGNPHIVAASKGDYNILPKQNLPTFPQPLPPYLPRTVKLPNASTVKTTDPVSANAGRFSLSLRGMRRDLRRAGGRAEALVRDVESELMEWLSTGGTLLAPDSIAPPTSDTLPTMETGRKVGGTGTVVEVSRTPLQLIWRIPDDAFARYVVHCCARYHQVVSYSKGEGGDRLTYLLRPNVTRPDRRPPVGLETPPATDIDYSSQGDTDIDSELISERELESESDLDGPIPQSLSRISESPAPHSPTLDPVNDDSWSVVDEEEEADEEFETSSEFSSALGNSVDALVPALASLSVSSPPPAPVATVPTLATQPEEPESDHPTDAENDTTIRDIDVDARIAELRSQHATTTPRKRDWASARSASSPSRSPVRRRQVRGRKARKLYPVPGGEPTSQKSLYAYVFL